MKQKLLYFLLLFVWATLAACTVQGGSEIAAPFPTATAVADAVNTQISHNGITLSYDPALLGDYNIQEAPASADQGMFEQPTPAHTWIGFVPAGIVRDSTLHWALLREPQIIVFNLNDFGSFAPSDERARADIATFQQLISGRPTTFSEPIPVLPPINAGQIIRTQVKWLEFGNGTGVRFLTQHDQEANPINNTGLTYVFYGLTADGLHGVTAVFPITAVGLPDDPAMAEADYTTFLENFDAEMTAVVNHLNGLSDADFNPLLSQLDALVQSIAVAPAADDFALTISTPQNAQITAETTIFTSPTGLETRGVLAAGEAVVVNAISTDGGRNRILCPDGATSNCWIESAVLQTVTAATEPVFFIGGMPQVGDVVEVKALINNPVHNGPGTTYQLVGELLANESVMVFGVDETGQWLAIECPRNIGLACWVAADAAVNEPVGFFAGDGWQDIASDYVNFRVPGTWLPTAVEPAMGSVLAEWQLGIPSVESDQNIAFFAVPFTQLKPGDVVSEDELLIGGQPGVKWVRSGEGYVSYDYYTAGTEATAAAGAGSFGLHVTVAEANPDLESVLDMVVASIIFNQ